MQATHKLVFRVAGSHHVLSRHGSETAAERARTRYANTARRSGEREDIRPFLFVECVDTLQPKGGMQV